MLGDPMHDRVEAFLGSNVKVRGDVSFSGGLRIDGEVRGKVVATPGQPATLVVSEQARVVTAGMWRAMCGYRIWWFTGASTAMCTPQGLWTCAAMHW